MEERTCCRVGVNLVVKRNIHVISKVRTLSLQYVVSHLEQLEGIRGIWSITLVILNVGTRSKRVGRASVTRWIGGWFWRIGGKIKKMTLARAGKRMSIPLHAFLSLFTAPTYIPVAALSSELLSAFAGKRWVGVWGTDGLLRLGVRLTAKRKNSININFLQQVPQSKHGLDLNRRPYMRVPTHRMACGIWDLSSESRYLFEGTADSSEF